MAACVAYGCTNRDEKDLRKAGITFHRFPHCDPERLQKWVINTKRDKWIPTARSRLCSTHFTPECFDRTGQTVRLRGDATPTIFAFPGHLLKKSSIRKPPTNRTNIERCEENVPTQPPVSKADDHQNCSPVTTLTTDHPYAIMDSPRKLKRKLDETVGRLHSCKKKLKVHQQKSRRLKQKVKSLMGVVNQLKSENRISSSCAEMLESTLTGVPKEIMQRILKKENKKGKKDVSAYPEDLKAFAMTLQFYSAKAYDYVRQKFALALPHPRQIREWYSSVDAEPGFTQPSFDALEARVKDNREKGKDTICAIMLDEMAIRKHVEFVNNRFAGYVNIGNGKDDDSAPVARNALVIMAVSVNESWKVPLAYFFIDSLSGEERANLVTESLKRLHDVGVRAVSLTCDGPSCHFSMMRALGASMSPSDLRPSFPHPADPTQQVHVILDVCHMLKLLRNSFAEGMILKDGDGGTIRWQYVEKLQKLQETEGLRLGTKLRKAHMEWRKQKMKVNLAAQVFSSSVADAIEYCSKHLNMREFQGSEPTVKFLRTIDAIFDTLNSRNPCARGYKAPMRPSNKERCLKILEEGRHYILGLRDAAGKPMHAGLRKTGYVGLVASMDSVRNIFNDLVCSENPAMDYLLAYKFSQDHLELFFSAVRCKGGFNNNPTCQQFKAAYKRLLMRHNVKCGTGNCKVREETSVLDAFRETSRKDSVSLSAISVARKYDMLERDMPLQDDHDYGDVPNLFDLSSYKVVAVNYIAGFVVKKLKKRLHCEKCIEALSDHSGETHPFIDLKNRGGLQKPSASVVSVCMETEKCFSRMLKASQNKLPQGVGISSAISSAVLQNTANKKLFPELESHMFDTTVEENHLHMLIKMTSRCFSMIRLHHLGKCYTSEITGTNIRKQLSKLIHFRHQ